jgi:hypothetical protein
MKTPKFVLTASLLTTGFIAGVSAQAATTEPAPEALSPVIVNCMNKAVKANTPDGGVFKSGSISKALAYAFGQKVKGQSQCVIHGNAAFKRKNKITEVEFNAIVQNRPDGSPPSNDYKARHDITVTFGDNFQTVSSSYSKDETYGEKAAERVHQRVIDTADDFMKCASSLLPAPLIATKDILRDFVIEVPQGTATPKPAEPAARPTMVPVIKDIRAN